MIIPSERARSRGAALRPLEACFQLLAQIPYDLDRPADISFAEIDDKGGGEVGDAPELWSVPLFFATCAIVSWLLRPADRRDRIADAGRDGAPWPETRPRAWAIPIGLLVVLYAVSFLSLPAAEVSFHKRAVKLGWIDK